MSALEKTYALGLGSDWLEGSLSRQERFTQISYRSIISPTGQDF
jgi:hypothetical protein